ncbi:MAG TPA: S8 family peptidase [Saprospiraceae bacterium]|nr:S8 family peptidase [Saprospiraceae bacterium]
MKKSYLVLWLLCTAYFSGAQKLDHVQGEILVQVQKESDIATILSRYTALRRSGTVRALAPQARIYSLRFDFAKYHEGELLEKVRKHPKTLAAQFNHLITPRQNIPDDPSFSLQWQWLNNGVNGKTKGIDTKAYLAWNKSTGGMTRQGREIVVAVIDDGTELTHPDLMPNTWVNEDEIPSNQLDDDQNGYVDDYLGWNILSGNDSIGEGEHGVSVNGLIGAAGNNQTGVSGINWNVKMMNLKYDVRQGIKESEVISGYLYVLNQRKIYNASQGQKGSFVVATNASWGIDNGKPEDAPLWCGIYDSLGKVGILNVAATDNRTQVNIDSLGDLPCLCPSDFLLAVTAIGSDGKRTGAYGVNNIDLAAPGDNVYTTRPMGMYGFDSGTSFAAPVIAGAIGYLYSNSCNQLESLALTDPSAATLQVREAILSSVEKLESLAGLVHSGGTLNLLRALDRIQIACTACTSRGLESRIYIDSLILDGMKFRSRDNFGYGDFTAVDSLRPVINLDGQILLKVYPYLKDSLTQYYLRVWLDRNHDHDFSDTAELVWDSGPTRLTGNLVSNIHLSPTLINSTGISTLRISLKAAVNIGDTALPEPCDFFNAGEVEDYAIQIRPKSFDCPDVLELDSTAVYETSAIIRYQQILPKLFYLVRYREASSAKWDTLPTRDTMVRLDKLKECTEYIVESKTVCDSDTTRFKNMFRFRTLGCTVPVREISPFSQVNIFPNPFSTRFTVRFSTERPLENVVFRVVDIRGSVLQTRALGRLGSGTHDIAGENYSGLSMPSGVYFVQLLSQEGAISRKILKF